MTAVIEGFCGACVAAPFLLIGSGMQTVDGDKSRKVNRKRKAIIYWTGFIITVISMIIVIYYMQSCSQCR